MPCHHNAAAKYSVVRIGCCHRVAFFGGEQVLENRASILIQICLHPLPGDTVQTLCNPFPFYIALHDITLAMPQGSAHSASCGGIARPHLSSTITTSRGGILTLSHL